MNIDKIDKTPYAGTFKKTTEPEDKKAQQPPDKKTLKTETDSFVRSEKLETGIYSRERANGISVEALMDEQQRQVENFQKLLWSMIVEQGQKSNLSIFGLDLYVTPEESAAAAESIAPGGEYSVDAVATRLMDMAMALAGGDSSKISLLRGAVQKGFEAAGVDFGGKLPSICNETYDEVMRRFDEWENESNKFSAQ